MGAADKEPYSRLLCAGMQTDLWTGSNLCSFVPIGVFPIVGRAISLVHGVKWGQGRLLEIKCPVAQLQFG